MKQADILRHAKDYLDKLDSNIDPITGQYLPQNSVGREKEVSKTFFFAGRNLGWFIAHDDPDGLQSFTLTPEQIKKLKPADGRVRGTELTVQINRLVDMARIKTLTTTAIKGWLCEQGYLQSGDTLTHCTVTPQGRAAGIYVRKGKWWDDLDLYPSAQQLIFDHLEDIIRYEQAHPTQISKRRVSLDAPENMENNYRAMHLLSQGRHPFTGAPLAQDDPVNQERLRTCFSYVAAALDRSLKAGYFTAKTPFSPPKELWAQFPTSQPETVYDFVHRVNNLLDATAMELLTGAKLYKFLCAQGFMQEERTPKGGVIFRATPEGEAWGIVKMDWVTKNGAPMFVYLLGPAAQEHLAQHMEELIAFCAR